MKDSPKTVAFVASGSGAGKTTLVEALIARLKEKGYRVGTVKHCGQDVGMDREGSDSWRFRRAGSDATVLAAKGQLAVLLAVDQPSIDDAVFYASAGTDIVLVEGYRDMAVPKIEIFRSACAEGLFCRRDDFADPYLIAVASDIPLDVDVPVLDLNDPDEVSAFIIERFLKKP